MNKKIFKIYSKFYVLMLIVTFFNIIICGLAIADLPKYLNMLLSESAYRANAIPPIIVAISALLMAIGLVYLLKKKQIGLKFIYISSAISITLSILLILSVEHMVRLYADILSGLPGAEQTVNMERAVLYFTYSAFIIFYILLSVLWKRVFNNQIRQENAVV